MEQSLKNSIENFLTTKVYNRALFISGKWGSGKTYFLKNTLKSFIEERGFSLFYISVNGIDNIPDLKKIIISKAIIGNSHEKKGLASKVKERIHKAVKYFDKADILFEVIEISDLINIDQTIFCFDDLERISSSLEINQLMGFINTELIEHKKCKVIFVGDITKNTLSENSFNRIKEKYIGWTLEYSTNNEDVLASIIKELKDSNLFHDFLDKHRMFILNIINKFEFKNYRTLQFTIETLRIIFKNIPDKYQEITKEIIYITTILCYEYKYGNLQLFINRNHLPTCITQKETYNPKIKDIIKRDVSKIIKEDGPEITKRTKSFCNYYSRYTSEQTINSLCIRYIFNKEIYNLITRGHLDKNKLFDLWDIQKNSLNSLTQ